jgi:3-methyladenine DNA glycosylase AlkC
MVGLPFNYKESAAFYATSCCRNGYVLRVWIVGPSCCNPVARSPPLLFHPTQVTSQFRAMCESLEADLEDTYIMGHRLVAFLAQALPQHPEYATKPVTAFRRQASHDLVWIRLRMREIALKIDEDELNKYISNDFDPILEDDSSVSSDEADTGSPWEAFPAFDPFDLSSDESVPQGADTDSSSLTQSLDFSSGAEVGDESTIKNAVREDSYPDPELENEPEAYFELDDSDEELEHPVRYTLQERLDASFLKQIACEEVRFETDSEAVDSWAQDGESGVSGTSSGTGVTCDPARIAFRELLNRAPKELFQESVNSQATPPPHTVRLENTRFTERAN